MAYVIWSNSGSVTLTDSRGDAFVSAGPATTWGSGYSAQVFYASGIAGGNNSVVATFRNTVSSFGVLYIHEYAGISATAPVDAAVAATGASTLMNSGNLTTTSAYDLLFAAGVSDSTVTAAGAGFTARDMAYGNITEDRPAATAGAYSATAAHNGSTWALQLVAFRAGS